MPAHHAADGTEVKRTARHNGGRSLHAYDGKQVLAGGGASGRLVLAGGGAGMGSREVVAGDGEGEEGGGHGRDG